MRLRLLARGAGAGLVLSAMLAGCADNGPLNYPSMSDITRVTRKLLTPAEREKAIRDLSLAQKTHKSEAIAEIEKR